MKLIEEAREIFEVALRSVDAGKAVRNTVQLHGSYLSICDTTINLQSERPGIYALAIGKAAFPMAAALDEILGKKLTAGLIVGPTTKDDNRFDHPTKLVAPWQICEGPHPIPNKSSLVAAETAFEVLQRANNEGSPIVFLISGGGSSMLEWPTGEQIKLEDLIIANRILVSCGASIAEINAVRRSFSSVKGGGLAARAPNSDQITLVVSDTGKGQESIVASGPTFDRPPDGPSATEVLARYDLADQLPPSILQATTRRSEPQARNDNNRMRQFFVLLDNESALAAATNEARRRGFITELAKDISDQPIAEGCNMLLSQLHDLHSQSENAGKVVCLISGGEFSCPVRGNGIGGRNAETALRCAVEIDQSLTRNADGSDTIRLAILSAGTDGVDGNSPAAGAVATHESIGRARTLGLDPADFLGRSDAYSFFKYLGNTIEMGPTGTNVRDLRILLSG